jgi:hypothetical protein
LLGFVEQPADQRRLAVIDRPAGDKAQQALAPLLAQQHIEITRGGPGMDVHQK